MTQSDAWKRILNHRNEANVRKPLAEMPKNGSNPNNRRMKMKKGGPKKNSGKVGKKMSES